MAFFEGVILTDSIEVKGTARDIFNFLTGVKKHMQEEGENLKNILESGNGVHFAGKKTASPV